MSESFVDLSYRGLALGKRIKLTQVRASAGYLELPTPMPVGTTIGIATEDGVLLEAVVAEVHEQVGGAERPPGMVIKPKLEADAARSWWKQRVTVDPKTEPAGFTPAGEVERTAPAADADGKVTVVSRRKGDTAVPEIVDDGRNTSVMSVIDDSAAAVAAQEQGDPGVTDPSLPRMTAELAAQVPIEDDGKRTMMMDAVDLAALGLDPSASGSLPAITDEDSGASGGDSKKKKKKRR